jgi:hypothetical protein
MAEDTESTLKQLGERRGSQQVMFAGVEAAEQEDGMKKQVQELVAEIRALREYKPISTPHAQSQGLLKGMEQESRRRCFQCGSQAHLVRDCPSRQSCQGNGSPQDGKGYVPRRG